MSRAPRVGAAIVFLLALQAIGVAATAQAPTPPPPPEAVRAEVTELPCIEPPADGTVVKVVDAAGAPVAGAIVTWFEEARAELDALAPEPALAQLRRDSGTSVRCGADGTTRIGRFFRVVASHGDRYAGAWRARRGTPLVLALQPRRALAVNVVDRDGHPVADVPLALRTVEETSGSGWEMRTDADGRAEFGPLDLYACFEASAKRELWIAVDAPLGAPVVQRIDFAELPATPIVLTLPPTGRLVIDVVDAEGRELEELNYLSVRKPWEGVADEVDDRPDARWPAVQWQARKLGAHHELPHVELGLRFVVDASHDFFICAKQFLDGPKKAGEQVSVRLAFPAAVPAAIVSGRLLDEVGAPLAATAVVLLWNSDAGRVGRRELARGTTSADGRIEAPLGDFAGGGFDHEIEPWIEAVVPRADGNGIEASGMVALPKTKEIGGLDFGEIRVRRSPTLAIGIVVDDAGAPVAGACLDVTVLPPSTGEVGGFSGDFTDHLLAATTGPDGRFTIGGDAPLGGLSIGAEPGDAERDVPLWHASESLELVPGATDLRFVLWRCGTIVAPVLGDFAEVDDLSYHASALRSDGTLVSGWTGGVDDDGAIEAEIPIGVAKLELSRGGMVLAVREGIEVGPGAVVEIEPIDLAAAAHQVVLTIVDEAGQPIPAGWIVMPNAEDDARVARMKVHFGHERSAWFPFSRNPNVTLFADGCITLRSDSPLPPFAVGAAGRAAVVVRHPGNSERIVLEPAPSVALVLEYDGEPVAAPLVFLVSLAADNDDEEWFRFGPDRMSPGDSLRLPRLDGIALERDQPVELPIRCLGRTRVSFVLGEMTSSGYGGGMVDGVPREITVARSAEDQVFRIKIDRAAIDAIVKQRAERQ